MNKRFLAGLMVGALLLSGAAFADRGIEVNIPVSHGYFPPEDGSEMEEAAVDEAVVVEGDADSAVALSAADIDLSGLSYDELVALKDRINLAIWECEEWQEVTVPQGVWVVGEDIPAGKWTIKCVDGAFRTEICWGDYLSDDGVSVSNKNRGEKYVYISNPDHKWYEVGDMTEYTVSLQAGDYVEVAHDEDAAVFMPYAGKPSLGFK